MTEFDEFGYDLDREKERRYAARHHFFWRPCPVCGFEYGGHEQRGPGSSSIPVEGTPYGGRLVCRRHTPEELRGLVLVPEHVERILPDGTRERLGSFPNTH